MAAIIKKAGLTSSFSYRFQIVWLTSCALVALASRYIYCDYLVSLFVISTKYFCHH